MAVERPDNDPKDDVLVDLNQPDNQARGGKKPAREEDDIELVDDTPEADRNRPPLRPGFQSAVPSDDEIGAYTKGVQDRLRKMSFEFHNERRAKEAALRENEHAIAFGKRLLEQNKNLQKMLEDGHKLLKDSSTKSAETEISAIKSALTQAIAAGDNAAVADLNEKLGRATARAETAAQIQPVQFPQQEVPEFVQRERQPQREQQISAPDLTETNQRWMDKNPWFGEDNRMTAIAMAAHERLLREGIRVESKAYYDGIDKEMREVFPDYKDWRDEGRSQTRRSTVAPTVRNNARPTGKVTLTASEQRVAQKLGVPLKEYAAQKLRLQQQEQD